jgi:hypothetical protein
LHYGIRLGRLEANTLATAEQRHATGVDLPACPALDYNVVFGSGTGK